MSALPVDNTPRFKVFYNDTNDDHVFQMRSPLGNTAFGSLVNTLLTALAPRMHQITIDHVEHAFSGSSVFNPVVTGIEGNVYATGTPITQEAPNYIDFVGRSVGGRRVRWTMFGVSGLGTDFRWSAGEDSAVDATIAALVAAGGDITCIDNLPPQWKRYANAGVNAHWQKATRP